MTKVFVPNAPACPECGEKLVWDEDEQIWYCLNCGYWEEEDEWWEDEDYVGWIEFLEEKKKEGAI